jgi:hypothetical protein
VVLSPIERWSAARRGSSEGLGVQILEYVFPVAAAVALVFLILLLWWVSHRRRPAEKRQMTREAFAEGAVRHGLSPRERQILLAVVVRSGLGRSHDIFTTVDAFDRGATKLLAECGRTRGPDEIERLKAEVTGLRQKLGFPAVRTSGGLPPSRRPGSRDIPVGKLVEVMGQRDHGGTVICGEVLRNDDLELAVKLEEPVASQAGDVWRVRYAYGASIWEYDTNGVGYEEGRLILNHVDQVRFVNRRRFTRVGVKMPALIAAFPFRRRDAAGAVQTWPEGSPASPGAPEFVSGMVTELAGPGLRIEALLRVCAGDRVLVAFRPTEGTEPGYVVGSGSEHGYVIEDIAVVRHCREIRGSFSIALELVGLTETEIDALVRLTNAMRSSSRGSDVRGEPNPSREAEYAATVPEI